jgi:chorismate mutase
MSITEHRNAIDRLDKEIVRLLNERTRHVLEIGAASDDIRLSSDIVIE